jgi:hypothetical protein
LTAQMFMYAQEHMMARQLSGKNWYYRLFRN